MRLYLLQTKSRHKIICQAGRWNIGHNSGASAWAKCYFLLSRASEISARAGRQSTEPKGNTLLVAHGWVGASPGAASPMAACIPPELNYLWAKCLSSLNLNVSEQTAVIAEVSNRQTLGRKTRSGNRRTDSCLCPFWPNLREIGNDSEEEILHFVEIALANTWGLIHQEPNVCFELATDCGGKRESL